MFSTTRSPMVLALGLLMASPVLAQENTYPGAMCVEVGGKDQRQKLIRDEEGQLFNDSPAHTLAVVCPVAGLFNDTSGGEAKRVRDRSSLDARCLLRSTLEQRWRLSPQHHGLLSRYR